MRYFLALLGAVWLGGLTTIDAKADPVVVELFTSQGCSSCPPADEVLGQLAERDDVIALSLHVDYWDYLGWKDSFSHSDYTDRQRRYAQTAGSTMVYTPQVVVGGRNEVIGTKAMKIATLVQKQLDVASPVKVDLSLAGSDLRIGLTKRADTPDEMIVSLVQYSPSETVAIKRGENAGREITYHNVVKSWNYLNAWDGAKPFDASGAVKPDLPIVVIVQDGLSGPILAAARLR